jgi:lactoylglutathione lyase
VPRSERSCRAPDVPTARRPAHARRADLPRARDLLGFEETFRTPRDGTPEHVELSLNGFALGLGTVEAAKSAHGVDASPGSPAMALVVWTDDVDKAFAQLTSAGVPVVQPPHNTGNNNRNALLRDPDGNLVEIVAKFA